MLELAPEDALRLHVMLAGEIEAIRIDESNMTVLGLTPRGEATVQLHPTGRNAQYLMRVRELLAGHALGSPGGYPVYLNRWTRMGQARDKGLDRLLLLGEPEAVVSVAYSNGLTNELARRAWWIMPTADNARRMLERPCVVEGEMGKVLAAYLIEHLPFETDPHTILDTVRIVLQPGLTDADTRQRLWKRARHDNAHYIGFLERMPDALPIEQAPRSDYAALQLKLAALVIEENIYAKQLLRILSGPGQAFLTIAEKVLRAPANSDVVMALLNAVASYFSIGVRPNCGDTNIEEILTKVDLFCADDSQHMLQRLLHAAPEHAAETRAMLALACMNAKVAMPILAITTAGGTLLRRKLEPITEPILELFAVLKRHTVTENASVKPNDR